MSLAKLIVVLVANGALFGCATYSTPGGPADFRALGITAEQQRDRTGLSIAAEFDREPAASFPARIAVVRLQSSGYSSYTAQGWGRGAFSVVSVRDVEGDEEFERLSSLPMVAEITPLNRLVVSDNVRKELDLREAAASVQADMLLIYTFDTQIGVDNMLPFASTVTLGLFPSKEARVTSTASAVLLDTRTGYVYGLAEATAQSSRITNAWRSRYAADRSRIQAEKKAWLGLVDELESMWRAVAMRYVPESVASEEAEPLGG